MIHHAGRKIAFEKWQELLANPRALPAQIAIRRVFAPVLSETPQILSQVFAALAEQWPNNRAYGGMDSRKTGRTRSAKNVRQNRLGLIVRRMRDDDARGAAFLNHAVEECVPEAAASVLQIPFVGCCRSRNVFAAADIFKPAQTS